MRTHQCMSDLPMTTESWLRLHQFCLTRPTRVIKKKKNPFTHQILAFNSFNSLIFKMDTNNIWRSMNKSMNDNCAAIYGTDSKGPHTDMDYGISVRVRVCVQEWSLLWGSQSQTCHNHGRRKLRVATACRWPPYLLATSGHTVVSSYPITQRHYSLLSANYQGTPKLDNWDQFPWFHWTGLSKPLKIFFGKNNIL